MASKYTHLELDRDIAAPAGYYTPQKETRLKDDGREVLCVLNQAVIDSSCCGVADYRSALVPGYIVGWHAGHDRAGNPVSGSPSRLSGLFSRVSSARRQSSFSCCLCIRTNRTLFPPL